jgi:hypothetical protein
VNTLTTAEVLQHMADNAKAGRNVEHGLEARAYETCEWMHFRGGHNAIELLGQSWEFRLAPKTITYTVTHPEPLRVAPKDGTPVWTVCTSGASDFKWWSGSDWQIDALERGNIFATEEDAQAADAARLAAYRGAV